MKPLRRVKTLLPGLDEVLGGGLFEAGVYFLQGGPGTGKTTFANQLCFAHAAQGGNALYLTLLAESHARMLQHMVRQSFFDASVVGNRIAYISGYRELTNGGLKGIVALLRAELARQKATLLVLDGLVMPATASADDDLRLKEFVHELQSLATLLACNVLLTTSGRGRYVAVEQTMVDGIFLLEDHPFGTRNERLFQVSKFRGAATRRGKHSFCITDDGIRIFPRLESLLGDPPPVKAEGIAATGLPGLDAAFHAGAPKAATATVLRGPSGAGKTLVALQFLAQSNAAEPGLMLGFNEAPDVLIEMAAGVGIDLESKLGSGAVEILWYAADNHALDQLGQLLLSAVDRRGVRRVVIDGLDGLAATAMFAERGYRFVAALVAELRRRSVTTILVCDEDALAALGVQHMVGGLGAVVEQVVSLSVHGQSRTVAVMKARGQRFDATPQKLQIGADGLSVPGPQDLAPEPAQGPTPQGPTH